MDIHTISQAIQRGNVRITDHADEEAHADGLTLDEVVESVVQGKIIEDYPEDFPYPSCLISGATAAGVSIHSVWGYNAESAWAVLITVYRPDPHRWVDWKDRVQE